MTFEEWLDEYPYEVSFGTEKDMQQAWNAAMEQAIPDGYVLVPVEPTENMWLAGRSELLEHYPSADEVYKAMIKAAQEEE